MVRLRLLNVDIVAVHQEHCLEELDIVDEADELILATNPTVQGEATAGFLQSELADLVPQITRLARGLPAGGDLEYVDEITLQEAFSGRRGWHD